MKITIVATGLLLANLVFASGTTIGNGGNSIVCKDSQGNIKSVEILDFYEVRLNGLNLKLNANLSNYKDILVDNLDRWKNIAPVRVAQYKKWLVEFESEALFASGVEIPSIPDTGSVVLPSGCELNPIAFQRPDSEIFPGVKRYTISKDLWVLMDEVQKAGLVMHELIYREGIKAKHQTSFPTRYFNGYLATAEPKVESYASIVSQLPLLWTEFGGLMIEVRSEIGVKSKITEDGLIWGWGRYFFTDILTEKFSIINPKGEPRDDSMGKAKYYRLIFDGLNFALGGRLMADLVRVSSERYHLEFDLSDIELFNFSISINQNPTPYDGPWFQCDCRFKGETLSIMLKNSVKNWIITNAKQRISNIVSIKFKDTSSSDIGTEIITSSGEIWVWDQRRLDYIRK